MPGAFSAGTHATPRMWCTMLRASSSGGLGLVTALLVSHTASSCRLRLSLPTAASREPSAVSDSVCTSDACTCRPAERSHDQGEGQSQAEGGGEGEGWATGSGRGRG